MPTRTLVLMRHAKSDDPGGMLDHDRPLLPRGRSQAALAGAAIRERATPDAIRCSDARRTRETLAAAGLAGPPPDPAPPDIYPLLQYTSALYQAGTPDVLGVIAGVPDDAATLVVVGHAPGMPATALALADPDASDPDALRRLQSGMPTSAFAVLQVMTGWSAITEGACRLTELVVPR